MTRVDTFETFVTVAPSTVSGSHFKATAKYFKTNFTCACFKLRNNMLFFYSSQDKIIENKDKKDTIGIGIGLYCISFTAYDNLCFLTRILTALIVAGTLLR